jgi:hypothetical protein
MTTTEPRSTPGMSYAHEDDIEWEQQTRASRRKILRIEDDLYVAIVRTLAPGERERIAPRAPQS